MEDQNITLTELKYRWTKPLADEIERLQAEVEELTEKVFVHSSAAMENLKEVERMKAQVPRWIPVTERLPELTEQIETDDYCVDYSKEVLIWSPMNMVPLFEIAIYTGDRGWTDPYFTRIKFQETITHWMPLPQPPQCE